jgi:tight adherence protein C
MSIAVLWSPITFAVLIGLAVLLGWLAVTSDRPQRDVQQRLDGYLGRNDVVEEDELSKPFGVRVLQPLMQGVLRALGRLLPSRSLESTREKLEQAGRPWGLTALDFMGLRVLTIVLIVGAYLLLAARRFPLSLALRNGLIVALVGVLLPTYWLQRRVSRRKHDIVRALPDCLDMLTIGVEAGLAFESALLRVGEKWDNPLTREFRRAVAEIRVGTARSEALRRVASRCGVQELTTFVAILVQSTELGVSIGKVLQSQAEDMRFKRRQRAEELARQAGIKMVFPLAVLVFPALLVVILGPSIPALLSFFGQANVSGGGLFP